jgi:hypothetical protein
MFEGAALPNIGRITYDYKVLAVAQIKWNQMRIWTSEKP